MSKGIDGFIFIGSRVININFLFEYETSAGIGIVGVGSVLTGLNDRFRKIT